MAKDFVTLTPDQLGIARLKRSAAKAAVPVKTQQVAMRARMLAPGGMKDNIRVINKGGAQPIGIIMVEHPAASFVLHGTRPHEIRPRNRKMLKFEVSGTTVFARLVHHPGTKPNNFLMKALIASKTL